MKIDALVEEIKEKGDINLPNQIFNFMKIRDCEAERKME